MPIIKLDNSTHEELNKALKIVKQKYPLFRTTQSYIIKKSLESWKKEGYKNE